MKMFLLSGLFLCLLFSCKSKSGNTHSTIATPHYELSLDLTRLDVVGFDPINVTVTLTKDSVGLAGQTLSLTVSKGIVSTVTDMGGGQYSFTVTPSSTGTYPITVSYSDQTITRKAVVLDTVETGAGQPMAVPGNFVNTEGYEDGVTVTPDGEYLFVQYGPFYFQGIISFSSICASGVYSVGYDLNTCQGRTNSFLVFDTIGPYTSPYRPGFPANNISAGKLVHLNDLILAGVANGLVGFPTVFYGFKRQTDGSFAEPFKVAFDDEKGVSGPFGLSFKMNGDGTAQFVVAWNNYYNDLGDDKPDIYSGTLTLRTDKSLGAVTYAANDTFLSITPSISPVNFSSHAGVQGNPHLYYNGAGQIESIWTDDEQVSLDLSVYRLTSGTFPSGTWGLDTLPTVINTGAEETQPFFSGTKLYFRRGTKIVSHVYTPTNGACGSTYTHNDCWGPEVIVLGANGNSGLGEINTVGEPTIATYGGKTYLYFVYVEHRLNSAINGLIDWNLDAAFVELP
ncbi:MAG: Ig-like domain-containing protein [Bacteriovorax sp.]|jgi:hypothetical protein